MCRVCLYWQRAEKLGNNAYTKKRWQPEEDLDLIFRSELASGAIIHDTGPTKTVVHSLQIEQHETISGNFPRFPDSAEPIGEYPRFRGNVMLLVMH